MPLPASAASWGSAIGIIYPSPWEKLKYDTRLGGFVVDLDRQTLEGEPSYSDTEMAGWEDPAWGQRVYDYYGAEPYWDRP
jgi:hypothetical protein